MSTNGAQLLIIPSYAMLVFLATKQFLGAVDTTRYPKRVEYQASVMEKYIEEVGPQNAMQICTNNAYP